MIDRVARNKMVAAIEAYMNDETTAFIFSDALADIAGKTEDAAVKEASQVLWYFYDDLKDHKMVASKESWNLMYRIILLLQSNVEVEKTWTRQWSSPKIIALGLILLLAWLTWTIGGSGIWMIVWLGTGLLTWEIDRRIRAPFRNEWNDLPNNIEVFPFDSVPSIFRAAKSVPDFYKRPFPQELAQRRIRNGLSRFLDVQIHFPRPMMLFFGFIGWTIVLPVVLLVQLFPLYHCQRTVIVPATGS
ncbi:MAG: hypothetical protein LBI05_01755 [Planctomycetaceae bacterium]|jgi:hypothetical protein|nr:hypothetical protein [Planctomycetaceae bacterium]